MDRTTLNASEALQSFCAESFDMKISPMSSAAAIRGLIRRTDEFEAAKLALASGLITDQLARDFVNQLMRGFVSGRRFTHETALAALATLFESHFSPFAEEYLLDLASLKLREIGHAIRVARECLQHRIRLPKTKVKTFEIHRPLSWTVTRMSQSHSFSTLRTTKQIEEVYAFA